MEDIAARWLHSIPYNKRDRLFGWLLIGYPASRFRHSQYVNPCVIGNPFVCVCMPPQMSQICNGLGKMHQIFALDNMLNQSLAHDLSGATDSNHKHFQRI